MTRRGVVALVFPITLLLFATFFFFGDLGYWNDDYHFTNRDPVTGGFDSLIKTTRDPFLPSTGSLCAWRPLHNVLTPALLTIFWDHDWIVHLAGVLLHAAAAGLFYALLRALGRSVHGSAAAVMLFIVWAAHYEVVLWPSAFATGLATSCYLAVALMYVRLAKAGCGGWWLLAPMTVLAAAVPCLNEQPAGMFAALPLAYMAVRPKGERLGQSLVRALVPTACFGAVCIAYILYVRANAQPGWGVSEEYYAPAAEWPRRLGQVARGMRSQFFMRYFATGALEQGWVELRAWSVMALLWSGALAGAAVVGLRLWVGTPTHGPGSPQHATARPWWVAAFGVAMFIGACLPLAVTQYYVANSRTCYPALLGVLLALTVIGDSVGRLVHHRPRLSRPYLVTTGLGLLAIFALLSVIYIGAQGRARRTNHRDVAIAARLRELAPHPPAGTIFLPLHIAHEAVLTGYRPFDHQLVSAWDKSWAVPFLIKFAYGRSDVYAAYRIRGYEPIIEMHQDYIIFEWAFDTPYPNPPLGNARFEWDCVIPFVVDERGEAEVVTEVVVQQAGLADLVIHPVRASRLMEEGLLPAKSFVVRR